MVLVMRCDEGPAWVPSRVVQCSCCGDDCWLSKKTGDSTVAASLATSGEALFCCHPCLERALAGALS